MQNFLELLAFPTPRPARLWPMAVATLALWRHRSRSRRHLAALDSRELADIGVSRTQQCIECHKRFWEP
jgi:uncharacterized protein YjiS (DUF1127 family)